MSGKVGQGEMPRPPYGVVQWLKPDTLLCRRNILLTGLLDLLDLLDATNQDIDYAQPRRIQQTYSVGWLAAGCG
ncbi:hypothetical protein UVI_02052440 [Ustilaginoidea virens]|uniref:Uncharacterized protein n=1 Tax=Ustilaginoidea virens TaxID=1159556 RepID=A0A1B5KWQ7_USTVR|nr:hypothetical protein UVI_02052440 [Ustilaginoidea virens]